MFTLGNLVCGFFAIVVASRIDSPTSAAIPSTSPFSIFYPNTGATPFDPSDPVHNAMLCGILIFLAMIFDALDGQVARLTRQTSDFGAQLDSLCDLVTFGVAPSLLLVKMCPMATFYQREVIWGMATAFVCCAALRLARFNVETDESDDHMHFSGLPVPAAGAAIAGFALLFYTLRRDANPLVHHETIDTWVQIILPIFAVLVALLMVSRVPYPHLVNYLLKGRKSFAHIIGLVFGLLIVITIHGYAVPILALCFVLGPPVVFFTRRIIHREKIDEPLF